MESIDLGKTVQDQLSFLSSFVNFMRKSSCHMEIWANFFVAFFIWKFVVQESFEMMAFV